MFSAALEELLGIVERSVAGQQTKNHRTVNQILNDLAVDFAANLAAFDAALPHDPDGVPS